MTLFPASRTRLLLACGFLFGMLAFGQNSGVQGNVTDSNGAVIVGAAITVANLDTGVSQHAESNEAGRFSVPLLNAGRYRIECSSRGFTWQERPEIRLEVDQTARVDFQLSVGAVTQTVDVTATSPLINSETTDVGQVIDSKRIVEMPLNGRNYLQLAQFTLGVQPAGQLGRGNRTAAEGGFLSMGIQTYQNTVVSIGATLGGVIAGRTVAAILHCR